MAKPDFRAAATARLNEERTQGLSQNVLSLLNADETTIVRPAAVRNVPLDKVTPNPNQPRLAMDKAGLEELTASVRELADAVAVLANHLVVDHRLVDRRKILALQVFDDGNLERRLIVDLLDKSRDHGQTGALSGSPAPLAGDDLKASGLGLTDDQRL